MRPYSSWKIRNMRCQSLLTGLAGGLLLCGCALSTWQKDGATPENMRQDAAQCDSDARSTGAIYSPGSFNRGGSDPYSMNGGVDANRAVREMNAINLCMRAKGYVEVPMR